MRAVIGRQFGGIDDLSFEEIPNPSLEAGTVRISVHAAGVSFANLLFIAGKHQNRPSLPFIPGTEVAGVVLEIAPGAATGLRVGDRVCVSGTPHCGVCYRCLRGRSDMCQFLSAIGADDLTPIGDLRDGTPVYENSHIGGLAQLMVTTEEWVVPIFTKADVVGLGMI